MFDIQQKLGNIEFRLDGISTAISRFMRLHTPAAQGQPALEAISADAISKLYDNYHATAMSAIEHAHEHSGSRSLYVPPHRRGKCSE